MQGLGRISAQGRNVPALPLLEVGAHAGATLGLAPLKTGGGGEEGEVQHVFCSQVLYLGKAVHRGNPSAGGTTHLHVGGLEQELAAHVRTPAHGRTDASQHLRGDLKKMHSKEQCR